MDDALNRLLAHVRHGTRPDLVLLDIMLSGEKSLPLLTDIRSHDALRDFSISGARSAWRADLSARHLRHRKGLLIWRSSDCVEYARPAFPND